MKITCLTILILLMGCHPIRHLTKTTNGYNKLPDEEYVLRHHAGLSDSGLLSTGHVYRCCACEDRSSYFVKFFNDGKLLEAETYVYESGKIDTTYYGGYFLLNRNNIKIEIPEGSTTAFNSSLSSVVYSGVVVGDTIKILKAQWRGKGSNDKHMLKIQKSNQQRCDYIKADLAIPFKIPDW